MSTPEPAPAPVPANFKTPDPLVTSEALGALVIGVITNVVILFGLHLSDARQAALVAIVNLGIVAAALYHGARVRSARAMGNAHKL